MSRKQSESSLANAPEIYTIKHIKPLYLIPVILFALLLTACPPPPISPTIATITHSPAEPGTGEAITITVEGTDFDTLLISTDEGETFEALDTNSFDSIGRKEITIKAVNGEGEDAEEITAEHELLVYGDTTTVQHHHSTAAVISTDSAGGMDYTVKYYDTDDRLIGEGSGETGLFIDWVGDKEIRGGDFSE